MSTLSLFLLVVFITCSCAQQESQLKVTPTLGNGFFAVQWQSLAYKIDNYWVAIYYGDATNTSTIFEDGKLTKPSIGPLPFSGGNAGSYAWTGEEYEDKDAIIVVGTDFKVGLGSAALAALKSGSETTYEPASLSNMRILTGIFIVGYKVINGLNPKNNNHHVALYQGMVPQESSLKATVAVGSASEAEVAIAFSALRNTDYTMAYMTGARPEDIVFYVSKRS